MKSIQAMSSSLDQVVSTAFDLQNVPMSLEDCASLLFSSEAKNCSWASQARIL
jgi:hypothetical protein